MKLVGLHKFKVLKIINSILYLEEPTPARQRKKEEENNKTLEAQLFEPAWLQQILIQWKGISSKEATWMNEVNFQNHFPFNIEDKVVPQRKN